MDKQTIYFIIVSGLYLITDNILTLIYKKRFQKNPDNVYKNPTNESHRFLGRKILMMQSIYILVLIYHLTKFDFGGLVSMIKYFNDPLIWLIGLIIGITFIILSIISRLRLGSSWRVGIDKSTDDKLITSGIYKFIRNPFFTSVLGFQFSLILISPNALTIFNFIIGLILWGFQARNEEEFLILKYGGEYENYKNKTGRFIPKLIKK